MRENGAYFIMEGRNRERAMILNCILAIFPTFLLQMDPVRFVNHGYLDVFIQFLVRSLEALIAGPSTDSSTTPASNQAPTSTTPDGWTMEDSGFFFLAVGDVAGAVGKQIAKHLDTLMPCISRYVAAPEFDILDANPFGSPPELQRRVLQEIPQQSVRRVLLRKMFPSELDGYRAAIECAIKLMKAAGPAMVDHMRRLIEQMFSSMWWVEWVVHVVVGIERRMEISH